MNLRHLVCTIIVVLFLTNTNKGQSFPKRIINNLFENDTLSTKKGSILVYPTIAYAPETTWELGLASVLITKFKRGKLNRPSQFRGFGFYTLAKQYGFYIDHNIFTNNNNWFVLGRIRAQQYPLYYYGIGYERQKENLALIRSLSYRIRERILKKTRRNWYAGLHIDYEKLTDVKFEWKDKLTGKYLSPIGNNGSTSFGIGAGVTYDSRKNALNPRKGMFSEIGYLSYSNFLGSTYQFNSMFFDYRYYKKINERNVWASQVSGTFSNGTVPFNKLNLMGGESIMRGHYLGKYRDKDIICAQTEFRWLPFSFSKRFGGALFASVSSVTPNFNFNMFVWSTGGGLKYLLFPDKDIYTRLDIGFTSDGYGTYLFIGEAF